MKQESDNIMRIPPKPRTVENLIVVPFPKIRGFWEASELLAGKTVYFHDGELFFCDAMNFGGPYRGVSFSSPATSPAIRSVGIALKDSGIIPKGKIVQLVFPENYSQVRDFFRLAIRTIYTVSGASQLTGVMVKELSGEVLCED